jgi:hypothetical protein
VRHLTVVLRHLTVVATFRGKSATLSGKIATFSGKCDIYTAKNVFENYFASKTCVFSHSLHCCRHFDCIWDIIFIKACALKELLCVFVLYVKLCLHVLHCLLIKCFAFKAAAEQFSRKMY